MKIDEGEWIYLHMIMNEYMKNLYDVKLLIYNEFMA